ncbi:MAG: DNA glycosylase, partial [bacterium]|nr:DNA glycosylase [bacterium]
MSIIVVIKKYEPKISVANNCVIISGVYPFDLLQTLDCGQAFRWSQNSNGSWSGIAFGKHLT